MGPAKFVPNCLTQFVCLLACLLPCLLACLPACLPACLLACLLLCGRKSGRGRLVQIKQHEIWGHCHWKPKREQGTFVMKLILAAKLALPASLGWWLLWGGSHKWLVGTCWQITNWRHSFTSKGLKPHSNMLEQTVSLVLGNNPFARLLVARGFGAHAERCKGGRKKVVTTLQPTFATAGVWAWLFEHIVPTQPEFAF